MMRFMIVQSKQRMVIKMKRTIDFIRWSWLGMGFIGALSFKMYPDDTGLTALIFGGMALIHGIWIEYKLEELKKDIEYKG